MQPIRGATGQVTISGVVQPHRDMLTSRATGRQCVCYAVVGGLLSNAGDEREAACDFIVQDESGRALIVMDRFRLSLGALESGGLMNVLEADIDKVSATISDLKAEARSRHDASRREVDAKLREMKALATLLCAIRAHARGNVHVGKSLAAQERFIHERSQELKGADTQGRQSELGSMPARYVQSHETILREGDHVQVTGYATQEPDPTAAAGYRDRPRWTVVRAPEGGLLHVEGEGAEAAADILEAASEALLAPPAASASPPRNTSIGWLVFIAAAIVLALRVGLC